MPPRSADFAGGVEQPLPLAPLRYEEFAVAVEDVGRRRSNNWSYNNFSYNGRNRGARGRRRGKEFSKEVKRQAKQAANGQCFFNPEHRIHTGHVQVDHVVPIARGGGPDRQNAKATCPNCNQSKGCMSARTFQRSVLGRRPRCQAITLVGTDCKRYADEGGITCWQHYGCV